MANYYEQPFCSSRIHGVGSGPYTCALLCSMESGRHGYFTHTTDAEHDLYTEEETPKTSAEIDPEPYAPHFYLPQPNI